MPIGNKSYKSDDGTQVFASDKHGHVFMLSAEDSHILDNHKMVRDSNGYFITWYNGRKDSLHRIIMRAEKGQQVDHINTKKWDNRRENLRLSTQQQNRANSNVRYDSGTGVKGVRFRPKCTKNPYQAQIIVDYRYHYLGSFPTVELAKSAYDKAADEYFGKFARA